MALPSHEQLLKFADDVRAQEAPFNAAAVEAFTALFAMEYRRLRAAQLEGGKGTVMLRLELRCNFERGTVAMTAIPEAVNPVPRRTMVKIATGPKA